MMTAPIGGLVFLGGPAYAPSRTPSPLRASAARTGPDPLRAQSVRTGPDPSRSVSTRT